MKSIGLIRTIAGVALAVLIMVPGWAGTVKIEKKFFEGWKNCYRMTNGEVELVAVADIGPRILKFGFVDGDNVLYVDPKTAGKTGGTEWNGYGGHRLWIAPETADITYYPDNFECDVQIKDNTLILTAPIEILDDSLRESMSYFDLQKKASEPEFRKKLRFRKQMEISMDDSGLVTILHRITNCGLQTHEMAAWVLTVMNQRGITVVPNPPYAPHGPGHWLPERAIVTWSYTNMVDPRLGVFKKYMTFRQDPTNKEPLKLGFTTTFGWACYALNKQLFLKRLDYFPERKYPDMGCSVEIFTNNEIMEVESIAPLVSLKPGETTSHRERWQLYKIAPIQQEQSSIERMLKSAGIE